MATYFGNFNPSTIVQNLANSPGAQNAANNFNSQVQTLATQLANQIVAERDESCQPLSILEVDLVISREKGKETRRLEMNFAGIDLEKKEMIEKSVSISRENFEILKHFFCHLDWNS